MIDRRNHDLYRLYDKARRLLYVGITNGGLRRFMEHAKDKTWWAEVASIDVEHVFCSRQLAEAIEREAIQNEGPLYNIVHASRPELPAPIPLAQYRANPPIEYQIGDCIEHSSFGRGIVVDRRPDAQIPEITVNFKSVGTKYLAPEWAPITLVVDL